MEQDQIESIVSQMSKIARSIDALTKQVGTLCETVDKMTNILLNTGTEDIPLVVSVAGRIYAVTDSTP